MSVKIEQKLLIVNVDLKATVPWQPFKTAREMV